MSNFGRLTTFILIVFDKQSHCLSLITAVCYFSPHPPKIEIEMANNNIPFLNLFGGRIYINILWIYLLFDLQFMLSSCLDLDSRSKRVHIDFLILLVYFNIPNWLINLSVLKFLPI